MFRYIPASKLHLSKPTHWLTSRFHFSFSEWYDPSRTNFGVLRVLNDDLVTPRNGFGTHPHKDMCIVSWVVNGELSHQHKDVAGGGATETLGRGSVQYMNAGKGVRHAEMNNNETEICRFLQIWIMPDAAGHEPTYGSKTFTVEERKNTARKIVTGVYGVDELPTPGDGSIAIHQDANVYVGDVDVGVRVPFELNHHRQAYFVCVEGGIKVSAKQSKESVDMEMRDALEIKGPATLAFEGMKQGTSFLFVEMAMTV